MFQPSSPEENVDVACAEKCIDIFVSTVWELVREHHVLKLSEEEMIAELRILNELLFGDEGRVSSYLGYCEKPLSRDSNTLPKELAQTIAHLQDKYAQARIEESNWDRASQTLTSACFDVQKDVLFVGAGAQSFLDVVRDTPVRVKFDKSVHKHWSSWDKLNPATNRIEYYEISRLELCANCESNRRWLFLSKEWQLCHCPVLVGGHAG